MELLNNTNTGLNYFLRKSLCNLLQQKEILRIIILPKAQSGVRFIVTNTWDEGLAEALKERGFKVFKTKRRSAKSVKDELVATNFNEKSGAVYTLYDTADAGRGLRQAGERLSQKEGLGEDTGYDAGKPKGEVEGAGSARVSDEIRDSGRGRGGVILTTP